MAAFMRCLYSAFTRLDGSFSRRLVSAWRACAEVKGENKINKDAGE